MAGFIDISSSALDYIGAVIILYGGATAVVRTLKREILRFQDLSYLDIHRDFTHKIVFGLDFLISGDVLRTIVAPTLEKVIFLGAIVGIRTVMVFFLTKEGGESYRK